jgi:hypothetical protein
MSTRRGWQATAGELDTVLRHLNIAQGADAEVRDGQLWMRPHPRQPWMAAVRIPAAPNLAIITVTPVRKEIDCTLHRDRGSFYAVFTSSKSHNCCAGKGR